MKLFSLQDKTALITGGGSGIGRAIAEVFAQQGATVGVIDLNGEAAADVATAIQNTGGRVESLACDVADSKSVGTQVDTFCKNGRLDILVNSAGIAHVGNLEGTSEADFDRLFRVNVKGMFNTMQKAIPIMKKQKGGVILNMASVAALVGIPDRFAYSATKGAVIAMTQSVARDYLKEGIRCNCISPARVHTPFVDGFLKANYPGKEQEMFEKLSKTQPIGRMATPLEIAYLALYLCSDEASFITGCDYPIDGGFVKLNN
jgi:NAD(P)-dependent dehydrogenase (short-subunit alcohol dehydrogenase family)